MFSSIRWQWEPNWQLFERSDAVKDDSVVVLCDASDIETSTRCDLGDETLLDAVIIHALVHACLVLSRVQLKLHRLRVGINREDIQKNFARAVIFVS